jgi:predicted PurR-regulated permease PerM
MSADRLPAMAYWARVTLTVAGALVVLLAAWRVRNSLLVVLVAAVFAVGLDPQVRWLQRRRLSRGWAVTVIVAVSVGLLVLVGWLVIPAAVHQTQALASQAPTPRIGWSTPPGSWGPWSKPSTWASGSGTPPANSPPWRSGTSRASPPAPAASASTP